MTAADFLATGGQILAEHGCDAVTIGALCETLSVSKGSFNHHFAGIDEFVERIAGNWTAGRERWLDRCAAEPLPLRRLEQLHQPLLEPPAGVEASWRAWAWSSRVVADTVSRSDQRWEGLTATTLEDLGLDAATASLLAEMDVALAIGLLMRQDPLEAGLTAQVVLEWLRHGLRVEAQLAGESLPQLTITGLPSGIMPPSPVLPACCGEQTGERTCV